MARGLCASASLLAVLALALFCCSSCIYIEGCSTSARCEKTVPLSAPLEPGSSFSAHTEDGSITLEGVETSECTLEATIVAHARTEERAEELIEQIDVRLEATAKGLAVVIDRPAIIRNAWFGVSLRGTLPEETDLKISTSDGSIHITSIKGAVEAQTSDGSIEVRDISGDTRLRTSDGSVTGTNIEGETLDCHTSDGRIRLSGITAESVAADSSDGSITIEDLRANATHVRAIDGAIRIEFASDAGKALDVSAKASDGSITLITPPGVSATVDAGTNDGSIHTDLPITIRGKVGKSLQGTIGNGEGRIYLRTNDGSITIR